MQLCKTSGLRILNYRSPKANGYTYFGPIANGCSVVDYVLADQSVMQNIADFVIEDFNEHSDHALLAFSICVNIVQHADHDCDM